MTPEQHLVEWQQLLERVERLPAGLTPAQEIRLRLIEALTNERSEPDEVEGVIAMAAQFAAYVDTGEADAEERTSPDQELWDTLKALKVSDEHRGLAEARLRRVTKVLDEIGMALPASDVAQLRAALEWVPDERGEHGQPGWGMDRPASVRVDGEGWVCAHPDGCVRTGPRFRCGACGLVLCSMHVGRNKAGDHPGDLACIDPGPTRVGYSETFDVSNATLVGVLNDQGTGFEPVTTVADPGGLLNDSGEEEA